MMKFVNSFSMVVVTLSPLLLRILYELRRLGDPFYMQSTCLLETVHTTSPDHFDAHPFWKHYVAANNATCSEITGKSVDQYVAEHVWAPGVTEKIIFDTMMISVLLYCTFLLVKRCVSGEGPSFVGAIGFLAVAAAHSSLVFIICHYQQDLTHLNGNLLHHSKLHVENNGSFVNILPPGMIFNIPMGYLVSSILYTSVLKSFGCSTKNYLLIFLVFSFIKIAFIMRVIHPFIHNEGKSWYKTYIPYFPYDEHRGHVIEHHGDGTSLGDSPLFNILFNYIMKAHAKLYAEGYIKWHSEYWPVINLLEDYALLFLQACLVLPTVLVAWPLLDKSKESTVISTEKKKN